MITYFENAVVKVLRPVVERRGTQLVKKEYITISENFRCHIQPKSERLDATTIGRFPEATHLLVHKKKIEIKANDEIVWKTKRFLVLGVEEFPRHAEVVIKEIL